MVKAERIAEMKDMISTEKYRESENEMRLLLHYIIENPADWDFICNFNAYGISMDRRLEIVDKLIERELYSVAYVVLNFTGEDSLDLELARVQIFHELAERMSVKEFFGLCKKIYQRYLK